MGRAESIGDSQLWAAVPFNLLITLLALEPVILASFCKGACPQAISASE
jgi:hypothetical protein